jgi:hypothetical protein
MDRAVTDLTGVHAKLQRADRHRLEFEELYAGFLSMRPYSISTRFDPVTGWHSFHWHVEHEPPLAELALIYGDILGNLRTTLDYLVWQLVLAAGNKPGRYNTFPVITRSKDWDVQSVSALRGVDERWVEEIKNVQPFRRQEHRELHPLVLLEEGNNLHKHRFLPAAVLTADVVDYLIDISSIGPGEELESQEFLHRPIVDGGELARLRSSSRRELDVRVADAPRFRLSFPDGLGEQWYMIELVGWVREVVARFEPAFLKPESP